VIDLADYELNRVRVHVGNNEKARWACLSHCWGTTQSLVLRNDNIEQLSECIDLNDLPKTYTDAITFCYKLGIRYPWLDALCIKQDDTDDWSREAVKMSTYYGQCFVCLAATQSFDHDGGCSVSSLQLLYEGLGLDGMPYCLMVREKTPHLSNLKDYEHVEYFPLLTRAWVYQERRLAPRVVHFCGFELLFECATITACECGREPRIQQRNSWTKADESYQIQTSQEQNWGANSLRTWHSWVESYSGLDLTYPEDRLPAMSGLAKVSRAKMEHDSISFGRYLAGLWESTLVIDMTWAVGNNTKPMSAPLMCKLDGYIAPSWSWASVQNRVSYTNTTEASYDISHCNIISVSIDTKTSDPMAQVNNGSIILRGKPSTSRWAQVPHYFRTHGTSSYVARPFHSHYFSLLDIKGTRQRSINRFEDRGMAWLPDYDINVKHKHQIHADELLFVFPLISWKTVSTEVDSRKTEREETLTYMYLVLRQTKAGNIIKEELPEFERVGSAFYKAKQALWLHNIEDTTIKLV
jgi:hypothetical protein